MLKQNKNFLNNMADCLFYISNKPVLITETYNINGSFWSKILLLVRVMPISHSPFPPSTQNLPVRRETPEGRAQSADCWVFS